MSAWGKQVREVEHRDVHVDWYVFVHRRVRLRVSAISHFFEALAECVSDTVESRPSANEYVDMCIRTGVL